MESIVYRLIQECEFAQFCLRRWEFKIEEDPTIDKPLKDEFLQMCLMYLQDPLIQQQFHHFAAFAGKEMIAIASLVTVPMVPHPRKLRDAYGYVTNVYTAPNVRNQGIGQQLIQCIKDWSITQDLELLLVWPSDPSIGFYKRLGFEAENQPLVLNLRQD